MLLALEDHMMTCSFKSTFGIECFGCGTQRAILALLQGDVIGSFVYNPGVLLLLLTLIAFGFVYWKKPKIIVPTLTIGVIITAVSMVVNFALKMSV